MSGSYLALMASVFHLLMTEPTLRVRGIFALLIFCRLQRLVDGSGFTSQRSGTFAYADRVVWRRASPRPPRQRPDTGPIAGQHNALPASLWHYCSLHGPDRQGPENLPARCWSSESSFWISPCRQQSMSLTRA